LAQQEKLPFDRIGKPLNQPNWQHFYK